MSMMKSGRPRRARIAASTIVRVRTASAAPVAETTMSAALSASGSDDHGTAAPPSLPASPCAVAWVRLAMVIVRTCCAFR